jgi:hypothetical protein
MTPTRAKASSNMYRTRRASTTGRAWSPYKYSPAQKNADRDAFAQNLGKKLMSACAGGGARKVAAGAENGYPFSLWMYDCALNPQTRKPETMWLKATSGADSLYSVQYAYRRALSKALIGPALDYLKRVSLCDARRADRPCPEGM